MMRVVLDTNVFISGIFFQGPPAQILQAWKDSRFELIISHAILEEYQRVAETLADRFPTIDISRIIQLISIHSHMVETNISIHVCKDEDDDKFIECAVAGRADVIVSGDKHLLEIVQYDEIPIITPRQFIDFLQSS